MASGMEVRAELAAAFEAGRTTKTIAGRLGTVEDGDGRSVPVYLNDQGAVVLIKDAQDRLDSLRPGPARRAGLSKHAELESFIGYVNRFKQAPSVVFADPAAFRVLAVLDYHDEGPVPTAAGWCGHRVSYECPRSRPWIEWTKMDGQPLRQDPFAEFVEEHLEDLTGGGEYPMPAAVLEMARDLRVNTAGRFERRLNPTTGEGSLVCKTENETTSTPIPRAFAVALPVFEGGDLYKVECRVRFRMENGAPVFSFHMHRRADVERDAFGAVRKAIADQTALPVFAGHPET